MTNLTACVLTKYLKNAHGDVLKVVLNSTVVAEYSYDAYGNHLSEAETGINNPIRYAGYYYDDETGNFYLKNRYYNSRYASFLTVDPYWNAYNMIYGNATSSVIRNVYYPAVISSGNRFAYCVNNPINFYDYSGLDPVPQWASRIKYGGATEEDYEEALRIHSIGAASAWAGSAGFIVRYAIDKALSEQYKKDNISSVRHDFYDYQKNNIESLNLNLSNFSYDECYFREKYSENIAIYESISEKTNIPPQLIAALHYRESACNFETYLHNGAPLGTTSNLHPQGILYYDFEEAAVAALNDRSTLAVEFGLTPESTDIAAMCAFAEMYNGLGYYNNGYISPYIYSGTDIYQKGKYFKDFVYDSEAVDKQLGVYALIVIATEVKNEND